MTHFSFRVVIGTTAYSDVFHIKTMKYKYNTPPPKKKNKLPNSKLQFVKAFTTCPQVENSNPLGAFIYFALFTIFQSSLLQLHALAFVVTNYSDGLFLSMRNGGGQCNNCVCVGERMGLCFGSLTKYIIFFKGGSAPLTPTLFQFRANVMLAYKRKSKAGNRRRGII